MLRLLLSIRKGLIQSGINLNWNWSVSLLALSLLMLRIWANDHDFTMTTNNLALLAHRLNWWSDLHNLTSCIFSRKTIRLFAHAKILYQNSFVIQVPISLFKKFFKRYRNPAHLTAAGRSKSYDFALHVILPLERSYGESSIVTLSPGRIFM